MILGCSILVRVLSGCALCLKQAHLSFLWDLGCKISFLLHRPMFVSFFPFQWLILTKHIHAHAHTHTHTFIYQLIIQVHILISNSIKVTNLALYKPTFQDSTNFGCEASRAVHGNATPTFGAGICTHTDRYTYPTWGVALQTISTVYYAEIMRRDLIHRGMCQSKCVRQTL